MITLDRLKKAKAVYNSIEIPEQLNAIVTKTIANTKEEKSHKARYGKYILSTVGGVFLTFVLMLNISPSFATTFFDISEPTNAPTLNTTNIIDIADSSCKTTFA